LAEIVCDGTTTEVLTPQVKPQPDGVHFRVDNRTEKRLGFDLRSGFGTGADPGVHEIEEGRGMNVPPGSTAIRCIDDDVTAVSSDEGYVPLVIVDQDGVWASETLQCPPDVSVGGGDFTFVEGAEGFKGDPVDAAKERYASLIREGDELRPAGYREAAEPAVVLIRDGDVRAVFDFVSDGAGGWLSPSYNGCVYPDD
jgi:hypothetical protein